jgi:putative redox protein
MTAPSHRVTFTGSQGADLAARLDLPAGPPRAYAVFAHGFTCSKDLRAAGRIAAGLNAQGIAVLRFDFTGLGASDGEFGNTDFSSNVMDLTLAASHLRSHYHAPQLLIGHSLGGAACIAAAPSIPEVRAVATIGSPASLDHLTRLFGDRLDAVRTGDTAEVTIAGRTFRVGRQFLDDLASHSIETTAGSLRRALLVLHSPVDETVSIDHAAALYDAARHPKSFVSLDGADHLLSRDADASFAAAMIGSWSDRYLGHEHPPVPPPPGHEPGVLVAETTQGTFLNHVVAGDHRFLADEPTDVGGFDAGPSPYDLVAAGLGACTSMTLRLYADRRGMPVDRILVRVAHAKVHLDDTEETVGAEAGGSQIDEFRRTVTIEGDLTEDDRAALARIAERCPVHRTLERSSRIVTSVATTATEGKETPWS